ncbi:unnamed protein product [Bursaphelenchus xylophilus]|uniref:(pine wood nematode) hypothetical protein n=1 Tax=Bursaphelenchus xylophilus TaxID=6326 RepID=A0A1I7RN48_BURXY|nr:unnamed protein product [Bursaphelenchus xylophilus]CAG9087693.1 unnamed protein product [Bursaphelenchus xylophilus]
MAPFHWQSNVNVQNVGVEDMVLLRSLNDNAIVDNLKKRLAAKAIFTYIGPVLISVNPFKEMSYFTEKDMEQYQGATQYENPPHIYALADNMYRNMMIDTESQCVIISGESGAGKTVAAKYIMTYVARISGGGSRVQHVKDVIIKSNPLLEAFGNAATLRNWNSSRFGKYVEIQFGRGGEPIGGKISNFLLEKSRVCNLGKGERNFHIFYQLLAGADKNMRENLGISNPDYYGYLAQSGCYEAEGTEDRKEFGATLEAMETVGISEQDQLQILQMVSAILHIGNITFAEDGNYAKIMSDEYLQFPAYLLGLTTEAIKSKLTSRKLESKWGKETEQIDVQLNVEQAIYNRDAWVKGMYTRLFDYLVNSVNAALKSTVKHDSNLSIGILDIYGFEIFDNNGFEQFCINFVNEKLQQIFIELTLKAEQEEYISEGIHWQPVDYFNNKIVCDLIEAKRPPGIMCHLDDICAQIHGQSEGCDQKFLVKMNQNVGQNPHYKPGASSFLITHYAGDVKYDIDGFCDKNRDVLYQDLIQLMQTSESNFIRSMFPESTTFGAKAKPSSAATKIRTQANHLVDSLMKCSPHYVRCIKPNERKKALEFDEERVKHQVRYLGLKENVRVRRAGYAYRRPFDKFLWRYAILTEETWPTFNGTVRNGCEVICRRMGLAEDQFQLGKTKIFIKNPESLFMLEEARERKYDAFARVLQKAFKKFVAAKRLVKQKEEASQLVYGKKQRRKHSINRNFVGDYIGIENRPALQALVGRRERIDFAHAMTKIDRRFKSSKVDVLLTAKYLWLIGRAIEKNGVNKGKVIDVVKRKIPLENITEIGLSTLQDDYIFLQVKDEYTSVLESPLKTEMLTAMNKRYREVVPGRDLPLRFANSHTAILKKLKYNIIGSPGVRDFKFVEDTSTLRVVAQPEKKVLVVKVPPGLPATTKPTNRPVSVQKSTWASRQSAARVDHHPNILSQHKPPQLFRNTIEEHQHNPAAILANAMSSNQKVHPMADQVPASRPVPKPKPMVKPRGPTVRAMYPYDAQDTDELSFCEGQIIELIKKDDSGWWQGRIGPKMGLFPANYVEEH